MQIQTKRDDEFIELDKVIIRVGDVDFRIFVNKFNDLVINKYQHEDGESSIVILPNVSNEIRIR